MNKVLLVGRLTKAPELRATSGGVSVATFTLAVRRNGEGVEYVPVVAWRGTADLCGRFLVKGQRAAVVGELRTRNYEDNEGIKRYITEVSASEVEFLDKPAGSAQQSDAFAAEMAEFITDEELPY